MKEMLNLLKIKTTEEKKDNINKVFASLGMVFLIVLSCLYLYGVISILIDGEYNLIEALEIIFMQEDNGYMAYKPYYISLTINFIAMLAAIVLNILYMLWGKCRKSISYSKTILIFNLILCHSVFDSLKTRVSYYMAIDNIAVTLLISLISIVIELVVLLSVYRYTRSENEFEYVTTKNKTVYDYLLVATLGFTYLTYFLIHVDYVNGQPMLIDQNPEYIVDLVIVPFIYTFISCALCFTTLASKKRTSMVLLTATAVLGISALFVSSYPIQGLVNMGIDVTTTHIGILFVILIFVFTFLRSQEKYYDK